MDADRVRKLTVRRVSQKNLLPEGDDRRVFLAEAEALEQMPDLGFALQVEPGEEHPVLRQKVADAKRVPRIARADHAKPREFAGLPQQLPPRDEGLEDDVGELRAAVQEVSQP